MIKIILADDHNIVRNGIKNLLEKEGTINITGEALNGQEALSLLEATPSDIILADMNMPVLSGTELAEKLRLAKSPVKVILLTMHDAQPYINKAFAAGVCGYLLKNASPEELLFCISYVHSGKRYLSNELSLRLLDDVLATPITTVNENNDIEFSEREIDVLKLVADGLTNQEIAERLFTSKRTVEGHRQVMINKTGVRNTAALVKFALQRGIL